VGTNRESWSGHGFPPPPPIADLPSPRFYPIDVVALGFYSPGGEAISIQAMATTEPAPCETAFFSSADIMIA
jgi:hypothetical protein